MFQNVSLPILKHKIQFKVQHSKVLKDCEFHIWNLGILGTQL
jgi:hypothetical protein